MKATKLWQHLPRALRLSYEGLASVGLGIWLCPVSFLLLFFLCLEYSHVLIANWTGDADKAIFIFCVSRLAEFCVHRLRFFRGLHDFIHEVTSIIS